MRLDMLLAREPFPETFVLTFTHYLRQRFDWQGLTAWRHDQTSPTGFLVNAKLNLIYPRLCKTTSLRVLAAEYAYHPNPLRRAFQRAYVHYSVTRPLRKFYSSAWVEVSPCPQEVLNWCILPGNHSIRIVDLEQNECIVLRKSGFAPYLLENLISMRLNFPDLPGPRLLEANSEQGWYREQRITGLPLNRLDNSETVKDSLEAARHAMSGLYHMTLQVESLGDWLNERLIRINIAVTELPEVYGVEIRERILKLAQYLANRLQLQLSGAINLKIPTALTHGDFQAANILVPSQPCDGSVYLIDWEHTGRRCIWYDLLVFELRSRFPIGLSGRILDWLQDSDRQQAVLAWCGKAVTGWSAMSYVYTFLLEDVLLRLVDTTIPGLRQQEVGFMDFINELSLLERRIA